MTTKRELLRRVETLEYICNDNDVMIGELLKRVKKLEKPVKKVKNDSKK